MVMRLPPGSGNRGLATNAGINFYFIGFPGSGQHPVSNPICNDKKRKEMRSSGK